MKIIVKNDNDQMIKFIDMLKSQKKDFDFIQTSHSASIKFKGLEYLFTEKITKSITFSAFKSIKSDIIKSGIVIDFIPRIDVTYFSVNEWLKSKKETPDDCYCIDINSAYLTTLLINGMITEETFQRVTHYGKEVRLKSVGMLATNKNIFEYKEGKLVSHRMENDKYLRNYFFFCCHEVGKVMNEIAGRLQDDFLFFWVDGIYVRKKERAEEVRKLLSEHGYTSKVKHLIDVNFYSEKECLFFSYKEELRGKVKRFKVPYDDEDNRRKFKEFLLTLKKETRDILES